MANVNTLRTRILNKYDTYENWLAATTFYPRAGEVCIAEMGSQNITQADGTQVLQPVIGIKVGIWDGVAGSETQKNFEQLPWIQAIAGDVYAWAKASVKPTYKASEIEELSTYIAGEIKDTDTQYQIVKSGTTYKLQSKAKDGSSWNDVTDSTIEVPVYTLAEGTTNGTVKFNETEVKVHGLGSAAYTETSAYATAAQGATADENKTAIADIKDHASVDSFSDVMTEMAKYQLAGDYATKTEAQGYANAKDEAIQKAQADATSANEKIDAFMADDAQVAGAIDTLVEINKYITEDTQAFTALSERVGKLEDGTTPAAKAETADTATNAIQLGGVAAASYALKTDVTDAVNTLDSSVSATAEENNKVSVLTGITQTDGKLTAKTEVTLAAVAKTGNVNDLIQDADDFLIFDCGSATRLIQNVQVAMLDNGSLDNIVLG